MAGINYMMSDEYEPSEEEKAMELYGYSVEEAEEYVRRQEKFEQHLLQGEQFIVNADKALIRSKQGIPF